MTPRQVTHDFIMYESDPFTVHTLSEHDKLTQTPCSPRTPDWDHRPLLALSTGACDRSRRSERSQSSTMIMTPHGMPRNHADSCNTARAPPSVMHASMYNLRMAACRLSIGNISARAACSFASKRPRESPARMSSAQGIVAGETCTWPAASGTL